ncbi:MAG: hypothetical protein ACYS0J_10560 [Planctomycetota bacterium]|jgi:hypothetical protein
MKMKTLSVLAGISTPLIATAAANAGLVSTTLSVSSKANEFGIFVCNVYAQFDNQGNDFMQAVAGTPGTPLAITVVGGTFWNQDSAFAGDTAPNAAAFALYPSLAFDTFATIGVKAIGSGPGQQPQDNTVFVPEPLPGGIAGTSIQANNFSWAVLGQPLQANPFDPINSFPGDGRSPRRTGSASSEHFCCSTCPMEWSPPQR